MTAALRLATPEPSLGESLLGLFDQELERNILGAAMLAEPMPRWLEPRHFFSTAHQRIYETVLEVGGNVAQVNAWLRESAPKYGPILVKAPELAEMCLEAEHARRCGWALDFDRLRELAKRRAFVELAARLTIRLRAEGAEDMSHAEAIQAMREHLKEWK